MTKQVEFLDSSCFIQGTDMVYLFTREVLRAFYIEVNKGLFPRTAQNAFAVSGFLGTSISNGTSNVCPKPFLNQEQNVCLTTNSFPFCLLFADVLPVNLSVSLFPFFDFWPRMVFSRLFKDNLLVLSRVFLLPFFVSLFNVWTVVPFLGFKGCTFLASSSSTSNTKCMDMKCVKWLAFVAFLAYLVSSLVLSKGYLFFLSKVVFPCTELTKPLLASFRYGSRTSGTQFHINLLFLGWSFNKDYYNEF